VKVVLTALMYIVAAPIVTLADPSCSCGFMAFDA